MRPSRFYPRGFSTALPQIAANLLVFGLWLWLFRPVYPYLATIFTRQEFRTNQIILIAALGLVIFQVRKGNLRIRPNALPSPYLPTLLLAVCSAAAFIAAERWLDINTLSATLFGLATYGLIGLWMRPVIWRRGLPAALLLVGALPFGEHMQTFAGYPLRLATARLVGGGLSALGAPNLDAGTILVFENGISQVDNPCSGVKSLWTGALFLLAATWIERHPINRRWLLSALVFAFLLVAANVLRVAVLVAVGQVLGWRLLAEMLHVPLGVIGFVAACFAGLILLRWSGSMPSPDASADAALSDPRPSAHFWMLPSLSLVLLGMILLYSSPPRQAAASVAWQLPAGMNAAEWPLTSGEVAWLTQDAGTQGEVSGSRWRFEWEGLPGSLILVTSADWRAHHRPERCFTVYGLQVQSSQPDLAATGFPLTLLTLGSPQGETLYSAAYWLQSPDRVTEDYAARIWDDLAPQPQTWVLATVLFDQPVDLRSAPARRLFDSLRQTIHSGLAVP